MENKKRTIRSFQKAFVIYSSLFLFNFFFEFFSVHAVIKGIESLLSFIFFIILLFKIRAVARILREEGRLEIKPVYLIFMQIFLGVGGFTFLIIPLILWQKARALFTEPVEAPSKLWLIGNKPFGIDYLGLHSVLSLPMIVYSHVLFQKTPVAWSIKFLEPIDLWVTFVFQLGLTIAGYYVLKLKELGRRFLLTLVSLSFLWNLSYAIPMGPQGITRYETSMKKMKQTQIEMVKSSNKISSQMDYEIRFLEKFYDLGFKYMKWLFMVWAIWLVILFYYFTRQRVKDYFG